MTTRRVVPAAAGALALLFALACIACAEPDGIQVDLIVRGGTVIDGTGAPPRVADVVVDDGKVRSIGAIRELRAKREIDAAGLVVAPGFVDLHSHADLILLGDQATQERLLGAKISQGVTTIIVGNCGLGVAPADDSAARVLSGVNGWMTPNGVVAGPLTTADYLERVARSGVGLNVGTLIPHGPVRISAMGLTSGAPTPEQLEAMRTAVAAGMDAGALGLSTGLIYPPGMYSATDELIALAAEVAARDQLFTSHVRGSSETLLQATLELIDIARRSGARVHHSHLEAVGEGFWPDVTRVLAAEDGARDEGLRISHDVFPYTRAATMMSAIFPPWALEGGMPRLLERLSDADTRWRLRDEIENRRPIWPPWMPGGWPHNLVGAVGWDGILVASVRDQDRDDLLGRSLAELAHDGDAFAVVAELMLAQDGQVGQLVDEISGRGERIDALLEILAHPAAAVISDAEDYGRGTPHPAHAGAFARALRWNREHGLVSLQELVRRMTGYPASLVGIERGTIRPEAPADLVVFDPASVADRATWTAPRRISDGFRWVLINGRVAVDDGTYVGGLHGNVLRAGSAQLASTVELQRTASR